MYALMSLLNLVWCTITRKAFDDRMPDAAFLESFAGPAYTPVWDFTTPPVTQARPYAMVTGYTASGDYVQAHTQELFDAACAVVDAYYVGVADELEKMVAPTPYSGLTPLDWAQVAEESLTHTKHVQTGVRIEHKPSSTERMRARRAANAAQGLTARGELPMNKCAGQIKDPTRTSGYRDCKRKAQRGVVPEWTQGGFCSLEHANQYGLGRVFLGEQTVAEAIAEAKSVTA